MELLEQINHWASELIRTHLSHIATAFTAALLVICGDGINRFFRNRLRAHSFAVRALTFALVCSLGDGFLAALLVPAAARSVYYFGERYAALMVVGGVPATGLLAERKGYVQEGG